MDGRESQEQRTEPRVSPGRPSPPRAPFHSPVGEAPEFLRTLWHGPEPQLLIDPSDGQIVDANEAAARFYGWSRELLRSFTIDRINTLPPAEIRARLAEARQRPRSRYVFQHRFADGRVRSVEVITGPVRIGDRIFLWSTLHDLSELVRRSPEFDTLARQYQALVEQLPAVVYAEEAAPPHRKIYVSPVAERLLGWPASALQVDRVTWYERYVLEEDRAWALHEEERTDRSGEAFQVEYRFRTGDGRTIWLRDEAVLVCDPLGQPWIWHGLLTDVTAQKRMEARLQRELAFHNTLLGVASQLVAASHDRMEAAITAALSEIGQFLAVDRLGLFTCEDETVTCLVHWRAPGLDVRVDFPDTSTLVCLQWVRRQLERGQALVLPALADLSEEANNERFLLEQLGIRSLLAVPLFSSGRLLGCLVAAMHRHERQWSEEEIDLVALVGQLMTVALQQRRAERAEAQHHAWLRATVLASPDALLVLDEQGVVRFASPAARSTLGQDPVTIIGHPLWELVTERERIARWVLNELAPDYPHRIEATVANSTGRVVELSGLDLRAEPHIAGIVLSVRDVSERRRAEQLLRERATRDQLTGLANRFGFLEELEALLSRSPHWVLGVLCCDLERFSLLNDAISWEAGDAALRAVAGRLRRVSDALLAARLEADRFAVLLGASDPGAVVTVAEELLRDLSGWYVVGSDEVYLRMRGGLAIVQDGDDAATVLRRAEIAFQVGKRSGRESLAVYDPALYQASVERQLLERDLRRALEQGDLRLHYQPVLDLRSQQVSSVETLVRWHHPTRGPVSPAVFVPLAEVTGLITQLTQWVLLQACRQLRRWLRSGAMPHLAVSVNLSPTDFVHLDIPQLVEDILHVTGIEPHQLTLELTESAILDPAVSRERLERLRALGVAVLIDDFGAGYSSLGYLKRLPVRGLKLDRELIRDIECDPASQAVVRSVLDLARALGLSVTAEGIENAQQEELLRELGCDYGQGFWLGRPLPPEELAALLRPKA
ncbi:EAL domain-containing protein [Thermomicrobium sp. CFH 73360]|uniref:sensor domain-containing protein n=1 Tax=Thermomicrobium sp. CFH 73360 TaxID=2951987 RepID=UPI002076B01D|nr:EAL domain-containing protein [Thermomicrobium sp. CFH 73360]